jgi:DNA-nicking Smr family endonuclease
MKRGLSREEAALWARVAKTVRPMNPPRDGEGDRPEAGVEGHVPLVPPPRRSKQPPVPLHHAAHGSPPPKGEEPPPPSRPLDRHGLDATWDRRLSRGLVAPDFTLDLHGSTLDAAHGRLEHGLTLAASQGARLVLLITGRSRPSADRTSRGVIRRKFMDWLEAGPHAGKIAAIRPAHPRHGGAGAVYIVLKRTR